MLLEDSEDRFSFGSEYNWRFRLASIVWIIYLTRSRYSYTKMDGFGWRASCETVKTKCFAPIASPPTPTPWARAPRLMRRVATLRLAVLAPAGVTLCGPGSRRRRASSDAAGRLARNGWQCRQLTRATHASAARAGNPLRRTARPGWWVDPTWWWRSSVSCWALEGIK